MLSSSAIRSLIRSNTNVNTNASDNHLWQRNDIGTTVDTAIGGFLRLMLRGDTSSYVASETIDPRFATHYDQHIRPQLDTFEDNRIVALGKFRKRCFIAIPLLIGLGVWWMTSLHSAHGSAQWLVSLAAFGLMGWASWPVATYQTSIRTSLFPTVFQFFKGNWTYRPGEAGARQTAVFYFALMLFQAVLSGRSKAGLVVTAMAHQNVVNIGSCSPELSEYEPFKILPGHHRARLNDFLDGEHQSVPIKLLQCELSVEERTTQRVSDKGSVFTGLLVIITVPKRFAGHTVVRRDKGSVGNWFGKQFSGSLEPVALEDPRFESRYQVYGTDQIEARYLLTPAFMERLVELEAIFAGHQTNGQCNIQCAFKDGKLLFTIPTTREWFSTGSIFKPANFVSEINLILKEMDQLFAIVDVLKLDDRTGL